MTPQQKFEIKELILSFSKKISELPEATTFGNQDFFAIAQNDGSAKVSKKASIQTFAEYIRARVSVNGATVYGVASPSGTPGTLPTNNDGVWFATAPGTYTNYGGITVSDVPKLVFYDYETQTWSAEELWKGGPNVVDNLTSTSSTDALSAKQGKVLKDLIDALPTVGAGTLNTTNTTTQATNASESLGGTVNLHKVSKTGSYNDLLDKPTIPAGTVTSVGMTVPTGLSVSGSPVTSSGTLAVSFATGYSIPTSTKQGQWDAKQDALVSGTNIKTINNQSVLGSGNITIQGGGSSTLAGLDDTTISSPAAGQLLVYDSTTSKWVNGAAGNLNYQRVTSTQYAAMQSGGTLQSNVLYIIVD